MNNIKEIFRKNSIMLWGKKMGMSHFYDQDTGNHIPVTALWIPKNQIQMKKIIDNKILLTIGCGGAKGKLNSPLIGFLEKNNLSLFSQRGTFKGDLLKNSLLKDVNQGDFIDNSLFEKGDYVDTISFSKGKGFAGVVKKYGHRIKGRVSVSLAHRGHQSIGNRTDPGKVAKGRPMPGQMGNERKTTENLVIVNIDRENSVIFVKGSVAGGNGFVKIRSSLKKQGCVV